MISSLHVDLGPHWRGGQSQTLLTACGLRARGHRAEVVALAGSPLARRAGCAGIPVHAIRSAAARLSAAWRLRQLVASGRFHLLHAQDARGLTAAWLARAHRRLTVVASRRVAYPLASGWLAQARYRAATQILAISQFVANSLSKSGIPADRIAVVHDGVELPAPCTADVRQRARARWGVAEDQPLIGCVGYLLPGKGQEHLLRAMPAVLQEFPRARVLMVGAGPSRLHLEALAREQGIARAVSFTGLLEDLTRVYAALDVFAFPALNEGLGTALLMAMSWGLPVVAVASGGVPEAVEDGTSGLLAAEPSGLAACILRLLRDPDLAKRLGRAARAATEQCFTADHMVEATLRVYEAALAGR